MSKLFSKRNIPNALTVLRLLLVPVFIVVYFRSSSMAALSVFIAAGVTDVIDGRLARRWGVVSNWGKTADPIADKLLVISAVTCLVISKNIPLFVIIVLAVKELIMLAGGLLIMKLREVTVMAVPLGKVAAAVFFAAVVLMFFRDYLAPFCDWLLYAALALNIITLCHYAWLAIRTLRGDTPEAYK